MTKLRLQANKVKHVLSANNDIPIYMDALHDDTSYQTHISRAKFEEICHDVLVRSTVPITTALTSANKTLDEIDGVEMIGGGMRVPKIQDEIRTALGGKLELGMHINSDESMALGAAFHGANVSTAFRVRHVGMTDINPFPISIDLSDLPVEESKGWFGKKEKKEDGENELFDCDSNTGCPVFVKHCRCTYS
jgi:hypoxia up-regulated 1